MSVSQSRPLALGIVLKLCAMTVLAIALARMYVALLGHHFEPVWALIPFLGIGLGALLCVPWTHAERPPFRIATMAHATAFAAGAASTSVVFGIRARSVDALDRGALLDLALFVSTSLLPFLLAGVSLVAMLSVGQRQAGELGKRGLIGCALGVVVAAFVMPFGPARVGLGAAIALAFASALIARASRRLDYERPAYLGIVATFCLGCSVLLAGEIGAPYLKVAAFRWGALERIEWQQWTNRGLISTDKPQAGGMFLRLDGTFGVSIPDGKQQPPVAADELAYVLSKEKGPVLILGAGGGRELRVALRQGQKEVYAIEPEPLVVREIMRGRSRAYSGEVYDKPEAHITLDGLRSALRHPPTAFRNVFVPYADTASPSPFGALAATPMPLLTQEALVDMLLATVPEGTVSISRPEAEADRVIALFAQALLQTGSRAPALHVFGCTKDRIATILAKRTALNKEEIGALRAFCRRNKLAEVVSPETPKDNPKRMLLDGQEPELISAKLGTNLVPPTDDRPFWHATMPNRGFFQKLLDTKALKDNHKALLSILGGLVVCAFFGLIAFVGSFMTSRHAIATRKENGRASLAFAAATAASVCIAQALMERFGLILGRADLAATLPAIFVFLVLGVGAGYSTRARAEDCHVIASYWAMGVLLLSAPLLMALEPLFKEALGQSLLMRTGLLCALVFLLCLPLGATVSFGARIAASRGEHALAWSMALAFVSMAGAALLSSLLAMTLGHTASLLLGLALLLPATALLPHAKRPLEAPLLRPEPIPEDRSTPIGDRVTLPDIEVAEITLDDDILKSESSKSNP